MKNDFNLLPWHDSELLSLIIDRSNAGEIDIVVLKIKWPNKRISEVIFKDCYLFQANMNFGVIAEETILEAVCLDNDNNIDKVVDIWKCIGVKLSNLLCFNIITNSTNSKIEIIAPAFYKKDI